MTKALPLLALALFFLAGPARAADGQVPAGVLQRLGLADLEPLSDAQGAAIRGQSGVVMARGLSLSTGLVLDRNTNSFVSGTDANTAISTAENSSDWAWTQALSAHRSAFSLNLGVNSSNGLFTGVLIGGAGGNACAAAW